MSNVYMFRLFSKIKTEKKIQKGHTFYEHTMKMAFTYRLQ